MLRPILIAALIAGTLDLLSAFVFAALVGTMPMAVLRFVASGPFGDQALTGSGWAVAGLAVHYAIMTAMVATFFIIAARAPTLIRHPLVAGFCYGLLLWGVMYWIVRPLRWPEMPLPTSGGTIGVAKQLFSHCVLVGIPIAVLAARFIGSHIDKRDAV
ncbi:MAG: hypothetical protein M3R64_08870 [Pseudomonadota bacterium]|nr:hypothetical protein [Pseudomonadota bacterium]